MSEALLTDVFAVRGIHEVLAFVGLLRTPSHSFSAKVAGIIKTTEEIIDSLVQQALAKKTAEEFKAVRKETINVYARAVIARSDLVELLVPRRVAHELAVDTCSEFEEEFRELALERLGKPLADQAIFTVWTLRKISGLLEDILANSVPNEARERDRKIADGFNGSSLWATYHLDCVVRALRSPDVTLYPEVRHELIEGLRAMVSAYSWVRQGVELRNPSQELPTAAGEWDEEDQVLLDASMRDVDSEAALGLDAY